MNYSLIRDRDISNGPGIRVSLFVSGCKLHCKGCFNSEIWDFNAGKQFTEKTRDTILELCKKPYISGFSILGGDPLSQDSEGLIQLCDLCDRIKQENPKKDIWIWTGEDFDTIMNCVLNDLSSDDYRSVLLSMADVVVDGPFVEEYRDLNLKFRGSKNQRIIDVKMSIEHKTVVTRRM